MPRREFNDAQEPVRKVLLQFIKVANGRQREVRRWDAEKARFVYANLGRRFFATARTEWIVEVPVVITGYMRNGTGTYEKQAYLPVQWLGVGRLTALDKDIDTERIIKGLVMKKTSGPGTTTTRGGPSSTSSRGRSSERPWKYSALTTFAGDGEDPKVKVTLEERLGALRPSDVLHPELFIPEAFEEHDDKACVVRQLAVVTEIPRQPPGPS